MQTFFIIAISAAVGGVIGWVICFKQTVNRLVADPDTMIQILQDYKQDIAQETDDEHVGQEVTVEQVNGVYYLYAKDTGQFLAQAATLADAWKQVETRFPDTVFNRSTSA